MSRIFRLRWAQAGALVAVLSCENGGAATGPRAVPRAIGVALVTFSNVTAPNISASVLLANDGDDLEARIAGAPASAQLVRLDPLAAGVFTLLSPIGKTRFLRATFAVQNLPGTTAFDASRENLSFIAATTSLTIPGTPVRIFLRGDQQSASAALARELSPTQLLAPGADGELVTVASDVLRELGDAELRSLPLLPSMDAVFPYAFVVRSSTPGSPFDGVVTFAFQIPDAPSPLENPNTIGVVFLLVDDGGAAARAAP